jgi:hypothetical protein
MIEELTSDVISIDSIQTAIESDIKEAFMTVHDATHEAEAEISQFFDFTTEVRSHIYVIIEDEYLFSVNTR